jgi:hypothetical protein
MSADETTFKIGPDYLNEVLDEAEVTEIRFSKAPGGPLRLDTDLSAPETIDKLVSGMSLLYVKLMELRRLRTP